MARLARVVIPGAPHHVTQRGNRREPVFFEEADYALYRTMLAEAAGRAGCEVWGYCLMPNHVHIIIVPGDPDGLRRTFADLHRRYTGHINARHRWTGHLWQGRFGSVAMDEAHFVTAARYVSLNPVRARLVRHARDWAWSSVRAHLAGTDDGLVRTAPLLERIPDFAGLIEAPIDDEVFKPLRMSETTGRPLGSTAWIGQLEAALGRTLSPRKAGRKARIE